MKRTASIAALLGAGLVAACATMAGEPPAAGVGPCDASAAQELVGEPASQELAAEAMRLSGAQSFRWIPEGSAVTMDYRPDRLNVEYNRDNVVTEIRCG